MKKSGVAVVSVVLLLGFASGVQAQVVSYNTGYPSASWQAGAGSGSIAAMGQYTVPTGWTANNVYLWVLFGGGGETFNKMGALGVKKPGQWDDGTGNPITISGLAANSNYAAFVIINYTDNNGKSRNFTTPVTTGISVGP